VSTLACACEKPAAKEVASGPSSTGLVQRLNRWRDEVGVPDSTGSFHLEALETGSNRDPDTIFSTGLAVRASAGLGTGQK